MYFECKKIEWLVLPGRASKILKEHSELLSHKVQIQKKIPVLLDTRTQIL